MANGRAHRVGEFVRGGGGLETQIGAGAFHPLRGLHHDGENLAHFLLAAAGEKADKLRVAWLSGAFRFERVEQRMADEDGGQAALLVERLFEREDAEHQVEVARHLRDAPAVPGPNLRADVVDDAHARHGALHGLGEAEIETGVVDEHERAGLHAGDVGEHPVELRFEVAVLFQHVPEPHHGLFGPVGEMFSAQRSHLASACAEKLQRRVALAERPHQLRAARVAAGLAGDEVEAGAHRGK